MAPKPPLPDYVVTKPSKAAIPGLPAVRTDTPAAAPVAGADGLPTYVTKATPKPPSSGGSHGGLGGNLRSLGKLVESVPRAVPGLVRDVGHDLVYAPIKDIAENVRHPTTFGQYRGPKTTLPAQQGESFKRTGGDIIHPGRFVEAYKQGQLPGKLLEDVANASIVASLAAAPLKGLAGEAAGRATAERAVADQATALGIRGPALDQAAERATTAETAARRLAPAGRVGTTAEQVAKLGAQGANLPIKPIEWAAQGIKRAAETGLPERLGGGTIAGRIGESTVGRAIGEAANTVRTRRGVSDFVANEVGMPALQRAEDTYAAGAAATKGLTPAENRAVRLTLEERFQHPATREALQTLADKGTPAELQSFYEKINPAGLDDAAHTITPEAVDLAVGHAAGTLPPEVAARMDTARDFLGGTAKKFEEDFAVPGRGRSSPLNPEQLGSEALTHPSVRSAEGTLRVAQDRAATAATAVADASTAADVEALTGKQVKADRKASKAEAKLQAAQAAVPADWADRIEAAPARHRPALQTAKALDDQVAALQDRLRTAGDAGSADALQKLRDDLPTSLGKLVDAGIDPVHVIGGHDPFTRKGDGLSKTSGDSTLIKRRLGSEQVREVGLAPQTVQGSTARIVKEATQAIKNEAADKFLQTRGVTAADLGLDPKLKGQALVDEMATHGKQAWDPNTLTGSPAVESIGAKTRFIDAGEKRAVSAYFKPDGPIERFMQQTFDKERRLWKDAVLPLSGQWHVGNIISNAVMATVGTGSLAWVGKLPEALAAVRAEGHGVSGVPARLFGTTVDHELMSWATQATGKSPNVIRRLLDSSYRANAFVDNLSRSAVYLAEHDRLIGKGLSATEAETQALRSSLQTAGDFSRMTRFEQQWMRRAMPFYSWSRHVTQLVSHLAIENPVRIVWTLHLGDMYKDPTGSPFGDSFQVGGGLLSVGNLSPLGQFQNLYLNPKGPVAGALQSLGPEIDVAAAALGGVNLGRGGQPLRLPPGSSRLDEFGNEVNTPLIGRPGKLLGANVPVVGALANYGLRQVPLLNTARQVAAGKKLAEYDTGEPILRSKRLIDSSPTIAGTGVGGRLGILARQAGVPTVTPFDVEASTATTQKRIASAKKSREKYAKQLAAARKHG